jgi:type IV pilus assembly protein PilM
VRLALPEERAYLFESSLERDLTDKEARTALEFRLEENVPLPARDALLDFDVIDHDSDEHTHRVSVTAYNRTTAEAYDAICRGAGFVPLALEVEPSAIARAVIPAGDEGTKLILDFGRTRTGIGIVHRGILMYTSTTSVGGDDLDNALRAVRPNATDDELVTIKNEQGLLIDEHDTTISNALQTPVEKMCGELKARIDYWHTHVATEPERRVTEVVLCGGLTNIAGLREYISEETGIRTARASVWQNVFTSRAAIPPITERQSYGYATAVGLALGGLLANARMYV